ncbi:MAG: hypothetical protein WBB07_23805 [Mycobacterium sp.]
MELTWWAVLLVGLAALLGSAVIAWVLPVPTGNRRLRPLAHVERLTRLPEYARVYRAYLISMVATLLLLVVAFAAVLVAAARPTGLAASTRAFDAAYPQDTMLCVGQDVTDPTSAELFSHFARQAQSYDRQRLGLTSSTLRVIPLTRDHTYLTDRLQGLARLAPIQQRLDSGEEVAVADRDELAARAGEFTRPIEYVDYAPSTADALALCMGGFPDSGQTGSHRRQLIYVGYTAFADGDGADGRSPAYTADAVRRLAVDNGVQVNVIARTDVVEPTSQGAESLRAIADATGGIFELYNPGAGLPEEPGIDPMLAQFLDRIVADPPPARLPDGGLITSNSWDTPNPVLIAALGAVLLLSVSLVVLRR